MIVVKRLQFILVLVVLVTILTEIKSAHATITITENTPINFGTVQIPDTGSQHIIISPDGSAYSGTGEVLAGVPIRGEFTVTGDANAAVSIDINNIASGSSEVTFDQIKIVYNDGAVLEAFPASVTLSNEGSATLYLGGRITFTNNISVGEEIVPSYTLVIDYE